MRFARPPPRPRLPPVRAASTPPGEAALSTLAAFTAADKAGRARALLADAAYRAGLATALRRLAAAPAPSARWDPTGASTPRRLLLAVLASDDAVAARALRDYCAAFAAPYAPPSPRVRGGVFVKYNPCAGGGGEGAPPPPPPRAAPYGGPDRGVLVTVGDVQVGHLPLGLLDEARRGEPPLLASW